MISEGGIERRISKKREGSRGCFEFENGRKPFMHRLIEEKGEERGLGRVWTILKPRPKFRTCAPIYDSRGPVQLDLGPVNGINSRAMVPNPSMMVSSPTTVHLLLFMVFSMVLVTLGRRIQSTTVIFPSGVSCQSTTAYPSAFSLVPSGVQLYSINDGPPV